VAVCWTRIYDRGRSAGSSGWPPLAAGDKRPEMMVNQAFTQGNNQGIPARERRWRAAD